MKQDEYSTAKQLWNAGAAEVQQLNPGESDQRQTSQQEKLPSAILFCQHPAAIIRPKTKYLCFR